MSRHYAVFGHPVAHSLSPRIHAAFGRQAGINVDYRAIDIRRSLAASDNANLIVETSANLGAWTADAVCVGEVNHGDGTATTTWRSPRSFTSTPHEYMRARFVLR